MMHAGPRAEEPKARCSDAHFQRIVQAHSMDNAVVLHKNDSDDAPNYAVVHGDGDYDALSFMGIPTLISNPLYESGFQRVPRSPEYFEMETIQGTSGLIIPFHIYVVKV